MSLYPFKTTLIAAAAIVLTAAAGAQTVKSTIALSSLPEGIAVNYGTNRIYAVLPSFGGPSDSVAVIDGKTDSVIGTISIPPIGYVAAADPLRNKIYIGGCYQDENGNNFCKVAVIDGRTNKVLEVIPITTTEGNGIQGIAVDPITGTVYVSNASDNVVNVIQCLIKTQVSSISLNGESPVGLTVNPFNNRLYVALASSMVDIVDMRQKKIVTSVTVGESNGNAAVDLVTGNVVVTNTIVGPSTLGVLKADGTVLANATVGNTPFGVDVDPLTHLAFVTNLLDQTVSVVNDKTYAVVGTLPVTGYFVGVNPLTSKVYVGGQDNSITVISEK
jgi:DNA-binding beta-propeller fold protein YncE